jgi:hypothetical protein
MLFRISTHDLTLDQDIQGFGLTSEVKVTNNIRFDGLDFITGPAETAQSTRVLQSGGPSNFTNGATFISITHIVNTIPSGTCNPEGNKPAPPPLPLPINNVYTGTVVYEDLWPYKRDYDLNDLVMFCKFNLVTDNNNKVTSQVIKLLVKAAGASCQNGFGIQFDNLAPSDVDSVTGSSPHYNYISPGSSGTENGQNNAVIIAFDNVANVFHPVTPVFFNTVQGAAVGTADTLTGILIYRAAGMQPISGIRKIFIKR